MNEAKDLGRSRPFGAAIPGARGRGDQEKRLVAVLEEKIIMDETTVKKGKPLINGFIPQLKGKKVTIRLASGGQPITGTIEGYNPYEILIQTAKGQVLVFKHAIATIEPIDVPKQDFTL